MAESLVIQGNSKEELYQNLFPQIKSILEDEKDTIANMANISACLYETFRFWWVGFYRVVGDELVLGPFQGPVACTRIRKGRGVCGTSWQREETIIVPDVDQFPGHIACSSASRSEIVVPVFHNGKVTAVLDIDSELLNTFDDTDKLWLERIAALLIDKNTNP
ncbi:MAG: GAF domain-containing protein [Bacteroidaceae bacterium]|nr:GAF domain-containing protein [Bacteroidaceae bacterium]